MAWLDRYGEPAQRRGGLAARDEPEGMRRETSIDAPAFLTRAQLLGGMLATGALAACGRAATPAAPPTASPECSSVSSPNVSPNAHPVHAILSDPLFDGIDKDSLAKTFDPSPAIRAHNQRYLAQTGRQPHTGNVISSIPSGGIVIQSPGTYTFASDIVWTPSDVPSSAITIQSNDVTLDLAGFTLSASLIDKSQHYTGILVAGTSSSPLSNIAITNGTVANVTENGILAASVVGLNISGMTVTGVCMRNLCTRLLAPSGIKVDSCLLVALTNCSVTGLNVTTDSCAAIFLLNTTGATVTGCTTQSIVNHDGAVQGFSYISCTDVATSGCKAQALQSYFNGNTLTTGHTVLGFCPIFCSNISYTDCSASGMTGCCDDCHAMSVFLDGLVSVTRFTAENVVDGVPVSGAKATGLEVYGVGVTVTDCTATNIKAINPQDKQSTGFSAWGLNIQFVRCTATDVVAQDTFFRGSRGEGFGWAPDPRPEFRTTPAKSVTYTDCTAVGCQVGFDTWFHQDSTWTNPTYTNCDIGILNEPGAKRTISCDPCSECNPAIVTTLTNIAGGNTFPT